MTNELTQMLTKKEVCDGGLSEKVCYDFAEELFGFDSANVNMVWIHSFMTTLSLGRSVLREPVAVGFCGAKETWKICNRKKCTIQAWTCVASFFAGFTLSRHNLLLLAQSTNASISYHGKKRPRWDETQLLQATLFFVHNAFFFWVKNIIHLRTLWKCIVLRKVYGGKGIKIVFFISSVRTFLLLTVADQLSKEKKISALCTRSLMRSFVAIR